MQVRYFPYNLSLNAVNTLITLDVITPQCTAARLIFIPTLQTDLMRSHTVKIQIALIPNSSATLKLLLHKLSIVCSDAAPNIDRDP